MFQKSVLLKCIASSSAAINQTANESTLCTHESIDSGIEHSVKKSSPFRSAKTQLKKSLNKRIKKSYNKIRKSKLKVKSLTEMSALDLIKNVSNPLFASTFVQNVTKADHQTSSRMIYYYNNDNCHSESDSDDDDESDIDASYMQPRDYDLNSSLSSVSSLEFEPFELSHTATNYSKNNSYPLKKSIIKPPVISSSKSNLKPSTFLSMGQATRHMTTFDPCMTSSRVNLKRESFKIGQADQVNIDEECCSMCTNSAMSTSASTNLVCSSTMIQSNKQQNHTLCNSIVSAISINKECALTNSVSMSSSSSWDSSSSFIETTVFKNRV